MSSNPSDDRREESVPPAQAGAGSGPDHAEGGRHKGAARAESRRRTAKTRRSPHPGHKKNAGDHAEDRVPDDAGERLREHAAEILSATRERIVEQPLQAVLVAAAAGAFAALLLGVARR